MYSWYVVVVFRVYESDVVLPLLVVYLDVVQVADQVGQFFF